MTAPHDHEVRHAVRQDHDRDGRQCASCIEKHVIGRQHDLLGLESQLIGDVFERVDGSAIDVGLAGLAQAAIVDTNAEAFQQTFEGGRTAVQVGALDDFRHQEACARLH